MPQASARPLLRGTGAFSINAASPRAPPRHHHHVTPITATAAPSLQASAYPGFGTKLVLHDQDHISVCKPASCAAPAYQAVAELLRRALHLARQQDSCSEQGGGSGDSTDVPLRSAR